MGQYFNRDTDASIKRFLESTVPEERHAIFDVEIRPAFEKLIESLIYTYGFYSIDDVETLKRDCLANLYEMLPKFDPARGAKGFSYFNVVAKHWFIQKTREKAKRNKLESDLYYDLDHEVVSRDPNFSISPMEDELEEREFWKAFYEKADEWRGKLTKKSEQKVLDAIIFLMKENHLVTIYNKKAVYLYLRDMSGLNTKQMVTVLKKIKSLYWKWKESYFDGET